MPEAPRRLRRGRAGAGDRPLRQDTKSFRQERQHLNGLARQDAEGEHAQRAPDRVELVRRGNRMVKRVKVGGCWYRTLDVDAGIRAYMGPRGPQRFWHGYYSGEAVDHYTGGVIPIVESASRQEYDIFDEHYDLVCDLLGTPPGTAIADKACVSRACWRTCASAWASPPPYGAKAEQLQLGQRTPPSRRPRGAPPGQTVLDIPDT